MKHMDSPAARGTVAVLAGLMAVALLIPAGARAVGSLVTIVGSNDVRAEVEGGHLLVTNSGKSPLTVRADDALPVAGTVGSRPTPGPLHVQGEHILTERSSANAFGARHFSYADTLAITSITISARRDFSQVRFLTFAGTDCDNPRGSTPWNMVFFVNRVREGTVHLPFPEPLLVSTPAPGTRRPWCVNVASGLGDEYLNVLTIGHVIAQG